MKHRAIVKLPEPLERILKSYALTAGAAGVGALALVQPSEAKIIYKAKHVRLEPYHVFYLSLHPLNSTHDFALNLGSYRNGSWLSVASSGENNANEVWGTSRGSNAAALLAGVQLGPGGHFSHRGTTGNIGLHGMAAWGCTSSGCSSFGPWKNVKDRYLGLKVFINGQAHYGWARLTVHIYLKKFRLTALLTGYAYETIPNKPITTGDTGTNQDASLTEPSSDALMVSVAARTSLGVLAAGAPALPRWRRSQLVVQKP